MRMRDTNRTLGQIQRAVNVLVPTLGLLLLTSCVTAQSLETRDPPLERLTWMQGYWTGSSDDVKVEELWFPPRGNVMVGLHVDAFPSGRSFFEYLRIEAAGDTMVYVASPMGRTSTRFLATLVESRRVVFENPDHDFPKRIEYRLDDEGRLQAVASGREGDTDRTLQWTWEKQPFRGD